jgi:UDPglucose--hexose-1-phosphate uridylyltransferase
VSGSSPYVRSRALGMCDVIVETREHEGDFHNMSLSQVSDFIHLLAKRTKELSSLRYVKQVMPFKNKGALIGVSLTHPHSQLYALPFVPPRIRREIASARRFRTKHRRNLFEAILEWEIKDRSRLIYSNERFTLLLPFFGMWPFETHVYTRTRLSSLANLDEQGRLMLADVIRAATAVYEEQFGKECAYIMVFHQAPSKGNYRDYRLHLEFYTPHISRERIKYAAGIEWGAGTFTYDGVPEERASILRESAGKALKNMECIGKVIMQ